MLVFLLIWLILFLIGLYSVTKKRTVEPLEADEQSSDAERVRVVNTDVTDVESKPKRPTTPQQITIETPLGQLTFIPKRNKPHVVIACGRSEEGIRWEFDAFLKRELKDAVANAKRYRKEGKPRSYWSDGYLEYILNAEDRFNNLERDRDATISRNGVDLAERRISVVGEFEAEGMIEANMKFLRKLGWLAGPSRHRSTRILVEAPKNKAGEVVVVLCGVRHPALVGRNFKIIEPCRKAEKSVSEPLARLSPQPRCHTKRT